MASSRGGARGRTRQDVGVVEGREREQPARAELAGGTASSAARRCASASASLTRTAKSPDGSIDRSLCDCLDRLAEAIDAQRDNVARREVHG